MTTLASWAGHLARELVQEPLPRRWVHVQGVAARPRSLAFVLGADDLLEAAAWLHDIGRAPGRARLLTQRPSAAEVDVLCAGSASEPAA